jgi:hypothetical protein
MRMIRGDLCSSCEASGSQCLAKLKAGEAKDSQRRIAVTFRALIRENIGILVKLPTLPSAL